MRLYDDASDDHEGIPPELCPPRERRLRGLVGERDKLDLREQLCVRQRFTFAPGRRRRCSTQAVATRRLWLQDVADVVERGRGAGCSRAAPAGCDDG